MFTNHQPKSLTYLHQTIRPSIISSPEVGLDQSTISTILLNCAKIEKKNCESTGNPGRKRQRRGKNAQLDNVFKEWFQTARQRDIPISGPVLQEKAIYDFTQRMNVADFNANT